METKPHVSGWNRFKKIFGVGLVGAAISLSLLAVFVWADAAVDLSIVRGNSLLMKMVGTGLIILGLGLHGWSFSTLRRWWSNDQLCTTGPFRFFRHPMYAAWITLICPGVALILNSWLAVLWIFILHPIWHQLAKREEKKMLAMFGDDYRNYARQTGRFIPKNRLAGVMKKNVFLVILGLLTTAVSSGNIAAVELLPQFQIMTENWVPYQFEEKNTIQGISVDFLVDLLKRVGSNQGRQDIKMVPWARGFRYAQQTENAILFLASRTPEREHLFRWVGPVIQNRWLLIAKKERQFKLDTPAELMNFTYGTVIDDVGEQYLLNNGIQKEQLERTPAYINCIKMLRADRVDMVVMSWETFSLFAGQEGIDTSQFESVYALASSDLYYAFFKGTPEWIVAKFQGAFDALKAEGRLDALKKKYARLMNG
jgi:polar amino acid transport system substrate-binding protein